MIAKIYYLLTGQTPPEDIVNKIIKLTNQEILEFIKRLSKHPFDMPVLYYTDIINNILWIQVSALKLIPEYENLKNTEIATLANYVLQDYYLETRKVSAPVYVTVATSTYLEIAIPLTGRSQRLLDNQYNNLLSNGTVPETTVPLEEEIDISNDFFTDNY